MRLIIFLSILLLSVLCSCRSHRQSVVDYADTVDFVADKVDTSHSADNLLSLISSSRELDLSGITVEFFPPDSLHPDARAAPKSLTIETVKAKETTEQTVLEQSSVDEQTITHLSDQETTSIAENTRTENDMLRPADWVVSVSIISAIIIISLIFLIKSRK